MAIGGLFVSSGAVLASSRPIGHLAPTAVRWARQLPIPAGTVLSRRTGLTGGQVVAETTNVPGRFACCTEPQAPMALVWPSGRLLSGSG